MFASEKTYQTYVQSNPCDINQTTVVTECPYEALVCLGCGNKLSYLLEVVLTVNNSESTLTVLELMSLLYEEWQTSHKNMIDRFVADSLTTVTRT
jgi:hypothetical protein